jgi:hypothetical protein
MHPQSSTFGKAVQLQRARARVTRVEKEREISELVRDAVATSCAAPAVKRAGVVCPQLNSRAGLRSHIVMYSMGKVRRVTGFLD